MGKTAKVLVFVFALIAILAGGWPLGVILFAYLVYIVFRRQGNAKRESAQKLRNGAVNALGMVLIVFSLIAVLSGGIFSPFVFGVLGIGILLRRRMRIPSIPIILRTESDSIVLTDRLFPFRRYLAAEIKVVTRHPAKALTAIDGTLVFRVEGKARAYLILKSFSVTARSAETVLAQRLRDKTRTLIPFGVYLMPLNGQDALSAIRCGGTRLKLAEKTLFHSLLASPLDVVSVETIGKWVNRLGAYAETEEGGSTVIGGGRILEERITLWEVVKAIEHRLDWCEPDETTVFLSSLAATRGEPMGERLPSVGECGTQTLLVRSLRSPAVELSVSQIRILAEAYS
jgi:hypothetical protein